MDLPFVEGIERAKRPVRLPVMLTREGCEPILSHMRGMYRRMTSLLSGAGLGLIDCVRLLIKDVDFGYNRITVRDGKG